MQYNNNNNSNNNNNNNINNNNNNNNNNPTFQFYFPILFYSNLFLIFYYKFLYKCINKAIGN